MASTSIKSTSSKSNAAVRRQSSISAFTWSMCSALKLPLNRIRVLPVTETRSIFSVVKSLFQTASLMMQRPGQRHVYEEKPLSRVTASELSGIPVR
jgi:hypothetical protein